MRKTSLRDGIIRMCVGDMKRLLIALVVWPSYVFGFYNPSIGRWQTPDPIEEEGGKNLYTFCGNNAIGHYDPLGRNIYLYQGNDSGNLLNDTFHQAVAVDVWSDDCPPRKTGVIGFSFGFIGEWSWNWPNGKWLGENGNSLPGYYMLGEVYEISSPPGNVIGVKETTSEQDREWLERMRGKTGMRDVYSLLNHNCRNFSQREFNAAP